MYHSLDKRFSFTIIFFTSQRESRYVLDLDFFSFAISSLILSNMELSRVELPKLTQSILMQILIISFVLVDQFFFYMHQPMQKA